MMACCVVLSEAQFFPKNSLGLRDDRFKARWYSSQLEALDEPSLLKMANDPASHSYRFLWLRTFDHPIAVRVELKPDGTGILTTKVASGCGGYRPGVLTQNTSRALTPTEVSLLLSQVEKVGFWTAPNPLNDQRGTDGAQWIIEGVRDRKYHVIDRWTPNDGAARDLGVLFAFRLAKLKVPTNKIY